MTQGCRERLPVVKKEKNGESTAGVLTRNHESIFKHLRIFNKRLVCEWERGVLKFLRPVYAKLSKRGCRQGWQQMAAVLLQKANWHPRSFVMSHHREKQCALRGKGWKKGSWKKRGAGGAGKEKRTRWQLVTWVKEKSELKMKRMKRWEMTVNATARYRETTDDRIFLNGCFMHRCEHSVSLCSSGYNAMRARIPLISFARRTLRG